MTGKLKGLINTVLADGNVLFALECDGLTTRNQTTITYRCIYHGTRRARYLKDGQINNGKKSCKKYCNHFGNQTTRLESKQTKNIDCLMTATRDNYIYRMLRMKSIRMWNINQRSNCYSNINHVSIRTAYNENMQVTATANTNGWNQIMCKHLLVKYNIYCSIN